jgi:hypothetical protein
MEVPPPSVAHGYLPVVSAVLNPTQEHRTPIHNERFSDHCQTYVRSQIEEARLPQADIGMLLFGTPARRLSGQPVPVGNRPPILRA